MSHLDENRMTYWQHWKFAAGHAWRCFVASVRLLIHAFIPCIYTTAGRQLTQRLNEDFTA